MPGRDHPPAAHNGRRGPWLWAAVASVCAAGLLGCALAANPQPPTLWLPTPVKDLTVAREGDAVHLHWGMPRRTTDNVMLKGEQRAHVCWFWATAQPLKDAGSHCSAVGDATFPPGKPADLTLPLPAELTTGPLRVAAFVVELQSPAGKTAGPSNPGFVPTGAAPPAVTGFAAQARAEGVVLHWDKAAPAPGLVLRIHRDLVQVPAAPRPSEAEGAPPPEQQTLEVDLDKDDPGQALDRDAPLDHTWKYTAERVLRVEAEHHALALAGPSSAPVTIVAKDVFPPRVPRDLAAVADAQAHAIDLSWVPDPEADLAGYFVYRRDLTAGGAAERISPARPLVPPSFSDTTVVPGHRYAYAVSAVDRDGNQSAPSQEVEEELPQ